MRKFCFVMIAVAALVVAGSSNNAYAANVTAGSSIVSPYWQADTNNIYTFIAVTAPSIASAVSRAVTVKVVSATGETSSSTLTIDVGSTARFFIVNTNHSSVNSNTVSGVNWITVTGQGHVVIETPYASASAGELSVWGAVVIPGGTGFAMEFVGDIMDSATDVGNAGTRSFSGL